MLSSGEKANPLGKTKSLTTRLILPRKVQVQLRGWCSWVREVDAPIRFDDHIVRSVETPPMIPIRHHRDTPIRLHARHTARTALAHEQSALGITGESIGVIRGLLEHGDTLPRRPLPPP